MISRLKNFALPLYVVILLILVGVFAALLFAQQYLLNPTYNYQVYLPAGPSGEPLAYGSWPALADKDFFEQVRRKFVDERGKFVEADLSAMKLRVHDSGRVVGEFPILSKGREGSWWETPAGLYKIETKEKSHFSSFGRVYQPWSMVFEGNFFIHGWPYYPDGKEVAASYSGGCIRLSTADAKSVFDLVDIGTPVLVYEDGFRTDNFRYTLQAPPLSAESYLAADLQGNFVFGERSPELRLPIASLTKLMTALVAVEYVDIEKQIEVTSDMLVPTSKARLKAGERYSLFNLLHPLLLESSNEAAEAIAGYLGRNRFVSLMNQKAKAVGMTETAFSDPSGRDDGNISSAKDLFALSKYLVNNRSFILKITSGRLNEQSYGPVLWKDLRNFNVYGGSPEFAGGKVGQSEAAGETILSIFNLSVQGSVRPIAIILLNSDNYTAESGILYEWVKANYLPITNN